MSDNNNANTGANAYAQFNIGQHANQQTGKGGKGGKVVNHVQPAGKGGKVVNTNAQPAGKGGKNPVLAPVVTPQIPPPPPLLVAAVGENLALYLSLQENLDRSAATMTMTRKAYEQAHKSFEIAKFRRNSERDRLHREHGIVASAEATMLLPPRPVVPGRIPAPTPIIGCTAPAPIILTPNQNNVPPPPPLEVNEETQRGRTRTRNTNDVVDVLFYCYNFFP